MKSRRWSPSAMPFAVRLEQLHGAPGLDVVEAPRQHAHHRALVIFIGAEHVEELQPGPLRRQAFAARGALGHRHVEQMLAPAIEIHRPQLLQGVHGRVVAKPLLAVAIGRRGGGIDQRRGVGRAPVEQPHRKAEIGLDHEIAVGRGGLRDGAEMDHGLQPAALQPVHQLRGRHEIGKLALGQIAPFAVMAEHVAHRHVARPASFNAATTFDPIKPAPPVTSNMPSPAMIVAGASFAPVPRGRQLGLIGRGGFTCCCGAVTDVAEIVRVETYQEMNSYSPNGIGMEDAADTRPILIVPYMWIGDFVRGHTVVRVLKQRWPNRPVDLLVTSLCAPLVDYMPGVRAGIVWDLPRSRLAVAKQWAFGGGTPHPGLRNRPRPAPHLEGGDCARTGRHPGTGGLFRRSAIRADQPDALGRKGPAPLHRQECRAGAARRGRRCRRNGRCRSLSSRTRRPPAGGRPTASAPRPRWRWRRARSAHPSAGPIIREAARLLIERGLDVWVVGGPGEKALARDIVAAGGGKVRDLTGSDLRNGILAMAAAGVADLE